MLNLFKSKKTEPSPQDVQNDEFRMQISQLNKALDLYRQTIDNHWGAITKLNRTPAASANYEVMVLEKIQKLETAVKTPPSTSQVRKLFADMADVVMRVSNLEGKQSNSLSASDKRLWKSHAMYIEALMDQVSNLTNEVELLKALAKVEQPSAPIQDTTDKRKEQLRKKREYRKEYYSNEKNREAHRQYMKQWNAKRKEKRQAEKYTEQIKLRKQAYYLANKEKILARLAVAREAKRLKAMK